MTIPRPEYPRPDFQRGTQEGVDWLNLNGRWRFRFDPEDVGIRERWFDANEKHFDREIMLPFPWESPLAWRRDISAAPNDTYFIPDSYLDPESVTVDNYRDAPRHTIGWYRRVVGIPEDWRSQRVSLNIGAADFHTTVYVNGKLVGEHEGGYDPFAFDITSAAPPGSQAVITIRVEDPQDHSQQPAGKQHRWYQRTSGIWQTVYLEPRGPSFFRFIHFEPNVGAEQVRVRFMVEGEPLPAGAQAVFVVTDPAGKGLAEIRCSAQQAECVICVPDPKLWDVDEPNLYQVEARIERGRDVVDRVRTYFAMRRVYAAPLPQSGTPFIWLNDSPIYILGALHQSFNPWGVYTYPSEHDIRRDLELTLDAGLNCLRVHIKVEEPLFYYWADKLGVLILYDLPNFGYDAYGDEACARWEATFRAAVERDFNHPSIIAWVLFNETWGLGGREYKNMPERQAWVKDMVVLARQLDPTRLIEDNSPCLYDHVETDINSWHFYINDYQKAKEHIANVVQQTQPGSAFNFCPGTVQSSQPLMNSEYGGISARMGDMDVSWSLRYLTNELRLYEKICGYVYTELTDIEWERNGIYNYDRTPKEFPYELEELHSPDFLALDVPPAQCAAPGDRVSVPVMASLFDRGKHEGRRLSWWVEHTDSLGWTTGVVAEGEIDTTAPPMHVTPLGTIDLALPEKPGLARLVAQLVDPRGVVLARNFVWFDIGGLEVQPAQPNWAVVLRPDDIAMVGFDHSELGQFTFGAGAGALQFSVRLPEDKPVEKLRLIRFVAELASYQESTAQTDGDVHATDVTVRCNGVEVEELTLPDCPIDSRGVLSYLAGIPGRRGYRVETTIYRRKLAEVLRRRKANELYFELEVKPEADNVGGLSLFFRQTGALPMSPTVIFAYRR